MTSKRRINLSRFIAVLIIAIQLVTVHAWSEEGVFDLSIEIVGMILLGFAALGRGWCSVFISGRKTHSLVTVGPYSIVRNPLYVFSFIGALGVGLASENILVLSILIAMFMFYYPLVIKEEEKVLVQVHGADFEAYSRRVPRFVPRISLYTCPERYEVDTRRVLTAMRDCLVFLMVCPLFEIIEHLQAKGTLPIIARIPPSMDSVFASLVNFIQ